MLPFKNIDNINTHDKNAVHGYVRRVQKLLKDQLIPLVINSICLLYFYETDQFGTDVPKQMMVNEDGTMVTMLKPIINSFTGAYNGCSCFGMMDIMNDEHFSKFIYQWRFAYYRDPILSRHMGIHITRDVIIGITDSPNLDWYKSDSGHHIALSSNGYLYQTAYISSRTKRTELYSQNRTELYSVCLFPKDEMIINIDIKEKKMKYSIVRANTIDEFKPFEAIPIKFLCRNHKYRMAVYCQGIGMNIKLIKFNKIVRTSDH